MSTNRQFDIHRFVRDHRLNIAPLGHKHNHTGWVNVPCPFCTGNPGYHLGFIIGAGRWNCYRCRGHGPIETIQALLGVEWARAKEIFEIYGGRPIFFEQDAAATQRPLTLQLPPECSPLHPAARRYLKSRNYSPAALVQQWGLHSTHRTGDYKFRIIAPITHEGKLVSFQGRDYTNKAAYKYKACPLSKEVVPHKHTLYGLERVPGHAAVIVEGVTDVWRLGAGAVGTFGTEWTPQQVNILRQFPRRYVLYDSGEEEAHEQGLALANALGAFSGITEHIELKAGGDPGNMSPADAQQLMKMLIGG